MKFIKKLWHYLSEPDNFGDYKIEWLISLVLVAILGGLVWFIYSYGERLLGTWG